jgi:hypothetical protein
MIKHLRNASRMKPMRIAVLQIFIIVFSTALLSGVAFAQSEKKPAPSAQNKRTTVNFEDQLVEGQTQKPELFYLLQQRNNNFKRLIKLRENFLPEMRKTSEEMNGKGSGS